MIDMVKAMVEAQPSPVQGVNSVEVLPHLIGRLRSKYAGKAYEAKLDRLSKVLYERSQAGIVKYGVPLTTNNNRLALVDGSQELCDGLMYFEQALMQAIEKGLYFPTSLLDKIETLIFELMGFMDSREG